MSYCLAFSLVHLHVHPILIFLSFVINDYDILRTKTEIAITSSNDDDAVELMSDEVPSYV